MTKSKDVAYLLYDSNGQLIDWDVSDDFMDYLRSEGFEDVSKKQVMEILAKHRREAEMIDESGRVVRPANATIN